VYWASAAALGQANLVVNGSFESGNFSGPNYTRVTAGSSALTGWTVGGVAIDWHNSLDFTSPYDGDRVADLHLDGQVNSVGTLSQTFATQAGAPYVLQFFLSGPGRDFGFPDPRRVLVDIAGQSGVEFSAPASVNTALTWTSERLNFVAAGNQTTLTFRSPHNGVGFWGPVLDNVSVSLIPEPSSAAMFAVVAWKVLDRRRRGRCAA
jgi:choice-of-anchor C domain-containing protein